MTKKYHFRFFLYFFINIASRRCGHVSFGFNTQTSVAATYKKTLRSISSSSYDVNGHQTADSILFARHHNKYLDDCYDDGCDDCATSTLLKQTKISNATAPIKIDMDKIRGESFNGLLN